MTRKHFVALAAAINEIYYNAEASSPDYIQGAEDMRRNVAEAIADACAQHNAMFDHNRFIAAALGD